MQIRRIEAHNFGAYADLNLDLTDINKAAVVGANGSGKSTLGDTILWNLWERGRSGNNLNAYFRDGETDMYVRIEYQVGEAIYRVDRRRAYKGKSVHSSLSLQRWVGEEWVNAVDQDGKADVQAAVNEAFGMTYEVFLCGAFIPTNAGRTLATMDRKKKMELFQSILPLDAYEPLAERAKQLRDMTQGELNAATRDLESLERQYQEMEGARAEVERLSAELTYVENQAGDQTVRLKELQDALAQAREKATLLQPALERLKEIRANAGELEDSLNMLFQRREKLTQVLAQEVQITGLHSRLQGAHGRAEQLDALFAGENTLNQKIAGVKDRIQAASMSALSERNNQTKAAMAERDKCRANVRDIEFELERWQQGHAVRISNARGALKTAQEQAALAEVPGCDSPSHGESCSLLERAYAAQHNIESLTQALDAAMAEEIPCELTQKLAGAKALLVKAEETLKEHDKSVVIEPPAELSAELKRFEEELSSLNVSAEMRAERAELSKVLANADRISLNWAVLQQAKTEMDDLKQQISGGQQKIEAARENERALNAEVEQYSEAQNRIDNLRVHVSIMEQGIADSQKACTQLREARASAQSRLDMLGDLSVRMDAARKTQAEASERRELYHILTQANGPNGIPVLIVDRALRDYTAALNRYLADFTNGEFSVRVETQKETQSGTTRETWEWWIRDPLGERLYERFSNAEQTHIDFAMHLAMRNFQTARTGKENFLLYIDEGWGAFDPGRLENTLAVIDRLLEEGVFKQVLVVSHIPAVVTRFPQQIRVFKDDPASPAYIQVVR